MENKQRRKKGDRLTGVWQNGGISAKLSICTSINIMTCPDKSLQVSLTILL